MMTRWMTLLIAAFILSTGATVLTGCEEKSDVEKAADKVEDKAEKGADKAGKEADDAKKKLEDATD